MTSFHDYRDLEVWERGMWIVQQVYLLTQEFPPAELYGMTSQMRRVAVSIPANIAEGWGRRYTAEFIQFLRRANGSRVNLCPAQAVHPLLEALQIVGTQLTNLERSLQQRKNSP